MNTNTTHNIILRLSAVALALLVSVLPLRTAFAQLATHPALDPATAPNMQRILLGDWGESVVDELFKARGYTTVNPTVGPHGLDRIVYRPGPFGRPGDIIFVEVKTRTAAGDLGLPGTSKNGVQLTREKVIADLTNAAKNHPEPRVKDLASEALERFRKDPAAIRLQRHVITIQDGRYAVYEGATAARPVGRPVADGSLDKVFERLSKSSDPDIAASARINRAYLRAQRASLRSPAPTTVAGASGTRAAGSSAARAVATESGEAVATRASIAAESHFIPTVLENGTVVAQTAGAADSGAVRAGIGAAARPLSAAASAAVAGLATSAVVAGFAGYDWYQGEISDARLHEELIRAGGDGIAVGLATGAVLLLTPAAPGVVIVAVGAAVAIAADVAFDWAMERENEHLAANEYIIRYGYDPPSGDDIGWAPQPPIPNPLAEEFGG